MTFDSLSSLERIGDSCCAWSGVEEVSIPDSVYELPDCCFRESRKLHHVTFGSSSSLERIGDSCCAWSGVEEHPRLIRELCDRCF